MYCHNARALSDLLFTCVNTIMIMTTVIAPMSAREPSCVGGVRGEEKASPE